MHRPAHDKLYVRWALGMDHPQIAEIATRCGTCRSPRQIAKVLSDRFTIGMVAHHPHDNVILGYMVYMLVGDPDHQGYLLCELAVHPDRRREYIGTTLLQRLLHKMGTHRRRCSAYVPESNLHAALFFRSLGFTATLERDFYDAEDAYRFTYEYSKQTDRKGLAWVPGGREA